MKISKTHHKTKSGVIKRNPRKAQPYEKVVFVTEVTHLHDHYYEDNPDAYYPNEVHTLQGKTKINHVTVPWKKAQKFYDDFMEQNADNPPYDKYNIKLAYDAATKERISLRSFRGN